jgi:hypothetical protein
LAGRTGRRHRDPCAASPTDGAATTDLPPALLVGRPCVDLGTYPATALASANQDAHHPRHAAAPARGSGKTTLDLQAEAAGTSSDSDEHPEPGGPDGDREPDVGLQGNRRRTEHRRAALAGRGRRSRRRQQRHEGNGHARRQRHSPRRRGAACSAPSTYRSHSHGTPLPDHGPSPPPSPPPSLPTQRHKTTTKLPRSVNRPPPQQA